MQAPRCARRTRRLSRSRGRTPSLHRLSCVNWEDSPRQPLVLRQPGATRPESARRSETEKGRVVVVTGCAWWISVPCVSPSRSHLRLTLALAKLGPEARALLLGVPGRPAPLGPSHTARHQLNQSIPYAVRHQVRSRGAGRWVGLCTKARSGTGSVEIHAMGHGGGDASLGATPGVSRLGSSTSSAPLVGWVLGSPPPALRIP